MTYWSKSLTTIKTIAEIVMLVTAWMAASALAADTPGTKTVSPDQLAAEQKRIAEDFHHFDLILEQLIRFTRATDPQRSALASKAQKSIRARMIHFHFKEVTGQLSRDQLTLALEKQELVLQDLRELLHLLTSESRAKRIHSEKARLREYLKQLNRLIKMQRDIQGRTSGGGETKILSKEQARLAKTAGELARNIKQRESDESDHANNGNQHTKKSSGNPIGQRDQPSPAKSTREQNTNQERDQSTQKDVAPKQLNSARQHMREAQARLEKTKRQGAIQEQEEALRQLQQAKAMLVKILRQLREEEIFRMLTMLESRIRDMLALQQDILKNTIRLDKIPKTERTASHLIASSRLGVKQQENTTEVDRMLLLLREDGTAIAFPEAAQQMRDDMQQVARRLARARVGTVTQSIEQDIIATLEEMLKALERVLENLEQQQQQAAGAGQCPDPPLVDSLAELKMIRSLQLRVNRRTDRYAKLIECEHPEQAELLSALRRLADRQQSIYRITRDLKLGKNR